MSDLELLQQYTRTNSQDAFATLVERHVHLVYSAARRQLHSPDLVAEVAQSVFLDLARNVARLDPAQPLAAWLFLVTRRTAIDVIRRESRRAARERTAAELSAAMETSSPSWPRIREVLDEAMESLDDPDRTALLLRFFENRSLREVGTALHISEDTAQKRVARALDRLRSLLSHRGAAAASVAALATDLSAHALETAPASLTATLTSTSFLASVPALATAPATAASAQTAGWTVLQKTAAVLTSAGVLGFITFETTALARQRAELAALPDRTAHLTATLAGLRSDQASVTGQLQAARETLTAAARVRPVDPELEAAIEAWLARVKHLQELAAQRPDLGTLEFAFLTDREWFAAAKDPKSDTEPELRETFKSLRRTARTAFAARLDDALDRYLAAHADNLPNSPEQLASHATPPLPVELLRDYEMLHRGPLGAAPKDAWLIAERPAAAARHGHRVYVSATQRGTDDLPVSAAPTP